MRPVLVRAAALLITFSFGLSLALLLQGAVGRAARRLALRAEERLKAPYVAEGEENFRKRRILFDLRDYWVAPDDARPSSSEYRDLDASGKELNDKRRRILPKVFPGGYLEHVGLCDYEGMWPRASSEADLARARGRKQFAPHMTQWKDGHFTEPGALQTLYVIDTGECNGNDMVMPSTRTLAVFDRWDGLYASVGAMQGEGVYAARDVDGDALDEVLLGRGEIYGLNYVVRMRLVSLKGGSLRVLHDFGITYIYSFADKMGHDRTITVPIIYYTPRGDGETPEFQVDYYRAGCSDSAGCGFMPKPSAWRYFRSGVLSESDLPEPASPWALPGRVHGSPSPALP